MKKFMLLVVVLLLAGCASTPEPQVVQTVYVDRVTVASLCPQGNCNTQAQASSSGSSYLVNLRRGSGRPQNCGGLTVDNYTDVSVIGGKTLYKVHSNCQTGNHEADGYCLRDKVSHKVDGDYPYGGLVEKQKACITDWSRPFCSQEPGRVAGEWKCLADILIALGEKEIGKARPSIEPKKQ